MINVNHLVHAYRQAPWRVQRQWTGTFLVSLLTLTMIAALYLDVTAQAAIVGREIQSLQAQIIETNRKNADLQTRLAETSSTRAMDARARELGFRPVEAGEIHYLIVPGYTRRSGVSLAETRPQVGAPGVPPEYTQSLLEWISDYLRSPIHGIAGEVLP
jgi:cell division protein FtsB